MPSLTAAAPCAAASIPRRGFPPSTSCLWARRAPWPSTSSRRFMFPPSPRNRFLLPAAPSPPPTRSPPGGRSPDLPPTRRFRRPWPSRRTSLWSPRSVWGPARWSTPSTRPPGTPSRPASPPCSPSWPLCPCSSASSTAPALVTRLPRS